jgi:Mrp family chromosome partitioning ATPase
MSRYFEVLQRTGVYADLFPADAALPAAAEEPGPRVVSEELRLGPPPEGRDREEITKLVQQVFLAAEAGARRAVLFCGIEDGEGSSRICAQAARLLAELGAGTVCLVDADWRDPSLHLHFWADNRRGLANALLEAGPIRGFARPFAGGKLWILPAGPAGPASAGMGSESLRARLAELRAEFDYVLLQAPPATSSADALVLGKLADGVVLVIAANATRRETTRQVKDSFAAAQVRLLGAVLDERTFPIPEALYRKL